MKKDQKPYYNHCLDFERKIEEWFDWFYDNDIRWQELFNKELIGRMTQTDK